MSNQSIQLTFSHLTFERNYQAIFTSLGGELRYGDMLQITGHNGSGKSTLLRLLAGLIEPTSGNIFWQGKSILSHRAAYQEHIHYLGHHHAIKLHLTVLENLANWCALALHPFSLSTGFSILEEVGLLKFKNTPAANLSAGQLRRLGLCRLLIIHRSIWILDEPSTTLDSDGQKLLEQLLSNHLENNGMAIIATHQALLSKKQTHLIHLGGVLC